MSEDWETRLSDEELMRYLEIAQEVIKEAVHAFNVRPFARILLVTRDWMRRTG